MRHYWWIAVWDTTGDPVFIPASAKKAELVAWRRRQPYPKAIRIFRVKRSTSKRRGQPAVRTWWWLAVSKAVGRAHILLAPGITKDDQEAALAGRERTAKARSRWEVIKVVKA